MQNKELFINALRFVVLVIIQVMILNNINFLGYINPYLYILFILIFPFNGNQSLLIFLSFILGLSIDMFEDSGGIHAGASVFIAFIRPFILKYSFGISYEYDAIKINQTDLKKSLVYFSIMILIHHLILFSLEIFNLNLLVLILKSTLFSGIFTFILILSTRLLFSKKN
ncbi:MAG: rod shape-determining protein MreD [Flavobacteriales bacterium]